MKACFIDIGTNSIHAILADLHADGAYRLIGKQRDMVRLGDGAMLTHKLDPQSMVRAVAGLKQIKKFSERRGAKHFVAVATSAVRESVNGGEFVDRVRQQTGLTIRVITGVEEGRLVAMAVRNAMDLTGKTALVVDIGGGSAEFALLKNGDPIWVESLKLGANRLRQQVPLSDPPTKNELKRLEKHIADQLKPIVKKLRAQPADFLIGTSGTMLNLVRIIAANGRGKKLTKKRLSDHDAPLPTVSFAQVKAVYKKIAELKTAERRKVPAVDKKRADMIVHGVAVVAVLMKLANLKRLKPCTKALREGMLEDFILRNRRRLRIADETPDTRRAGVMQLLERCDTDLKHARHAAVLTLSLFDVVSRKVKFLTGDRELLEYAALLHDIGYHVNYRRHHRHAQYLISHADLPGFSEEETRVMAWCARFHRGSPDLNAPDFLVLAPRLRKRAMRLASLLRLADALDHSHFSLVKSIKGRFLRKHLQLDLQAGGDIDWEIYEANRRKDLFEKNFGFTVSFERKRRNSS